MILEQHRWVQGFHLNAANTLFGGQLLSWVDEDTNMLAHNSCYEGAKFTTLGYDRVRFLLPIKQGERLRFRYSVVHVGRSSMMVLCRVFNRKLETSGPRKGQPQKVFEALNTMCCVEYVYVGDNEKTYDMRPAPVDKWLLPESKKAIEEMRDSPAWKWMEQTKEVAKEGLP